MKNYLKILVSTVALAYFAILSSGCKCESVTPCIDESKICITCLCTADYNPVCGCDGVTYSNSCMAEISGVTSYTQGECGGN